ncbi:unnamed protein product [Linum trigynum]|uniref:Uncharacterized protein n=1 Tax=Linum trigynum TaxID=586398 RepID=A0AAV2E719_9ROSI
MEPAQAKGKRGRKGTHGGEREPENLTKVTRARVGVDSDVSGVEDDAQLTVRPRTYLTKHPRVWVTRRWRSMCGPRLEIEINGGDGPPTIMIPGVCCRGGGRGRTSVSFPKSHPVSEREFVSLEELLEPSKKLAKRELLSSTTDREPDTGDVAVKPI